MDSTFVSLTTLSDYALAYAEHGWGVFPVASYTKVPAIDGGLNSATLDPNLVRLYWQDDGIATPPNIGLRTGDGLLVLDVDGAPGAASLANLEARHDPLPPSPEVVTGGGGRRAARAPSWSRPPPLRHVAAMAGLGRSPLEARPGVRAG